MSLGPRGLHPIPVGKKGFKPGFQEDGLPYISSVIFVLMYMLFYLMA
jgi:hypothetical protein